jgi:hypothetical protein
MVPVERFTLTIWILPASGHQKQNHQKGYEMISHGMEL